MSHLLRKAQKGTLRDVPKMCQALTLYFEAVTTMSLGILGFHVSPYLCNSFDTILITLSAFVTYESTSGSKLYSKLDFAQNWNSIEFFTRYAAFKFVLALFWSGL